jgi:hypothetical protein
MANLTMEKKEHEENIQWIDVESPTYADRNKDIVEKILFKMRSGFGGLD